MSTLTNEQRQLLVDVQMQLDASKGPSGVDLKVIEEASRAEEDWLYIVIAPTRQGIRAYDYVDTLSQVEKELRKQGRQHVLLLPAMAD